MSARRGGRSHRAWGAAVALVVALGCHSTPQQGPGPYPPPGVRDGDDGVIHTLRAGENLYRLSKFYGVPVDAIATANRIDDVTALQIGQQLWIPGAGKSPPGSSLAPRGEPEARPTARSLEKTKRELDLIWPVRGRLSSRFGWRNGRRHEGIDIPARRGTPIRAAQAGRVIHSGWGLGDYGKVVIVKHTGHYSTVYAHNDRVKVKKGQFIERGDVIATVGTSGNASGPHVHFELRRDRKPLDPLVFLP